MILGLYLNKEWNQNVYKLLKIRNKILIFLFIIISLLNVFCVYGFELKKLLVVKNI